MKDLVEQNAARALIAEARENATDAVDALAGEPVTHAEASAIQCLADAVTALCDVLEKLVSQP